MSVIIKRILPRWIPLGVPMTILIFLLGHMNASAETYEVKEVAAQIPRELIAKGVFQIGPLNLQSLVVDIESKVQYAVIPVFSIGAGTNDRLRTGSSCHMSKHRVYVNEPHLHNLKHIRLIRALLLHESLCALGWNDDNYTISATLDAVAKIYESSESSDPAVMRDFLGNVDFQNAFFPRLRRHYQDQHYSRPDKLMVAGGGVTGVGGGGDGFGLHLKSELFRNFFAIYSECAKPSQPKKIQLQTLGPSISGINFAINCFETRFSSWWEYIFAINVETAYFQVAAALPFPNDLPWVNSFLIERVGSGTNRSTSSEGNLQITINLLRWMLLDQEQWLDYSQSLLLTLLMDFYQPKMAIYPKVAPIFEVTGKKELVASFRELFKYAPAHRCVGPTPKGNFDFGIVYASEPSHEFLQRQRSLTEQERLEAPNCVHTID